jgi:hypothetical protein
MSAHAYAETSSATMHAGFSTPLEHTLGAPNLFILNNVLQYICKCTQTHTSTISKKMNLLYVAVYPSLYTHYSAGEVYSQDMYPFPDNVDEVPDFTACTNNIKWAAAKILHTNLLKMRNNIINMNAALINTLLSLIPMAFKLLYKQERMMDPNAVFQQCFDWFVVKYRHTLAEDRKTNRMAMATNLHPSMGFEEVILASSVALLLQAFPATLSQTKTWLTVASAFSTAWDSSWKSTRLGFFVATTPAK